MLEKRLSNFMSIEGVLLLVLGFFILILPRLTSLSFNTMLGVAFIIYGVFKFVYTFINKNLYHNFVCQMLLGIMLFIWGILLLIPSINIHWLMAFIGIYLVLESITSAAFVARIKDMLNFWYCKPCISLILLLSGLFILVRLVMIPFSTAAVITAICFILKGACKKMLNIINRYNDCYVNRNDI